MKLPEISRRDLIKKALKYGGVAAGTGLLLSQTGWLRHLLGENVALVQAADSLSELAKNAPLARFWISTKTDKVTCKTCHGSRELEGLEVKSGHDKMIKCQLCSRGCMIPEGGRGKCQTRVNVSGQLRSLVYGRPITIHVDPIEKKPFYHFLPGSAAYSIATSGCPLSCKFCQNWSISQARPEDYDSPIISPERIAEQASSRNAPVIAYTYNEPSVFTEYLTDIARVARPMGLRSVLVSCGFMTYKPLAEMCEVLDGIKIDLKGFSRDFYRNVCDAELDPVLRSIKQVSRSKTHLEIVNLVVPTLNDSDTMLKELASWIVGEIGPDVPLHFTRFHPDYKLRNLPPTPTATLERARQIAMDRGIHYVYVGNRPGHPGNNTYCPSCGKAIIVRSGFFVEAIHMKEGRCIYCNRKIAGVWS